MTENTSLDSLPTLLQPGKKIAFICASWHGDIVSQARNAFVQDIKSHGIGVDRIDHIDVPGSLEIPLQCQLLANSGVYQLIVASGLIVDGGIYRHDFVASTVLDGMMRVQLDTGVPVLSVVLTPHHFNEQEHHQQFFHDHFKIKGREAAAACIQVLNNQLQLEQLKQVA